MEKNPLHRKSKELLQPSVENLGIRLFIDNLQDNQRNSTRKFKLTEDDEYAIEIAINVARDFLRFPSITSQEVIGLGHALYALERLPKVTPGVYCQFGIFYRAGDKEFSESKYITFTISDYSFEISIGGSVYEKEVGSDRYTEPGWLIDLDGEGYRNPGCALFTIEDQVREYINLGAQITVDDQSAIDMSYNDEDKT